MCAVEINTVLKDTFHVSLCHDKTRYLTCFKRTQQRPLVSLITELHCRGFEGLFLRTLVFDLPALFPRKNLIHQTDC